MAVCETWTSLHVQVRQTYFLGFFFFILNPPPNDFSISVPNSQDPAMKIH